VSSIADTNTVFEGQEIRHRAEKNERETEKEGRKMRDRHKER
jgi:hypothetical protein